MSKPYPVYRLFSRWQASLSKRLFWRQHLAEAQTSLQMITRELPTPEMMVAAALIFRGKGYYKSLELQQDMAELMGLVRVLTELRLERVCEIGTFKGGTLYIWCQLAEPQAQIVSIDLPGGPFGGGYSERSIPFFQSFCRQGQQLTCLRGNSRDRSVKQQLERILAGSKLDFLFIDGDHTYQGVKGDFELYSPLVRPGGLIALHDIVKREGKPSIEVYRFWGELKHRYRYHEFVENSSKRGKIGIGLIYQV